MELQVTCMQVVRRGVYGYTKVRPKYTFLTEFLTTFGRPASGYPSVS